MQRHFIGCEALLRQVVEHNTVLPGRIDEKVIGGIIKAVLNKSLEEAIERKLP